MCSFVCSETIIAVEHTIIFIVILLQLYDLIVDPYLFHTIYNTITGMQFNIYTKTKMHTQNIIQPTILSYPLQSLKSSSLDANST